MQTHDASGEFLFKLWPWLEANKNRLIAALVAVVIAAGIIFAVFSHREQKQIDAGQALTMLLVSPATPAVNAEQRADALAQLAAQYPGTEAGQRARLQGAAALFDAGHYADAQTQFQKFLDHTSSGAMAATAQLGVAASLEAQNKLELAATAYQKVVSSYATSPGVLPAEFALGRIAEQQNKLAEAMAHYESAARNPLGGSLAQEAAQRAFQIKTKLASAAPKPAVSSQPPLKLQ